jgi:fructokinase
MSSSICVTGIGEVLMDVFENGEATLGGAPFNVVFHLHQLLKALALGEAYFVSAVGRDAWGRQVHAALAAAGMSSDFVAEVDHPTGSALVFEHGGSAGFEIRPDVAWDFVPVDDAAYALARRADAVVFGSLAQRSETSRAAIRSFVSQVRGHRLYDVNLRRNTTNGVAGYSTEIIVRSLRLASVVKMNDAELDEVAQMLGFVQVVRDAEERAFLLMERLRADFSLTAVAVTRGPKGALLTWEGRQFRLPDSRIDQSEVHPVGAGDSFAAGLLFGMIQGWAPEECLALAEILSSWVVRHVSATPPLPESILAQVRSLIAREARKLAV